MSVCQLLDMELTQTKAASGLNPKEISIKTSVV